MQEVDALLDLARRKAKIDATSNWSLGSVTYLEALTQEVDEVLEELPKQRQCYLEDELGDLLWNYLNALLSIEKEANIDVQKVFARALAKYEERTSGIEQGELWKDIKVRQKAALEDEYQSEQSL